MAEQPMSREPTFEMYSALYRQVAQQERSQHTTDPPRPSVVSPEELAKTSREMFKYRRMHMETAAQITRMYNDTNTWLSKARTRVHSLTLQGGMRITLNIKMNTGKKGGGGSAADTDRLPMEVNVLREEDEGFEYMNGALEPSGPEPKRERATDQFSASLGTMSKDAKRHQRDMEQMHQESDEHQLILDPELIKEWEKYNSLVLDERTKFGCVAVRFHHDAMQRRYGGHDEDPDADEVLHGNNSKKNNKKKRKNGGSTLGLEEPEKLFSIPEFGTGFFALKLESTRAEPVVVWIDLLTETGTGKDMQFKEDPDVKVFVWPDCRPSMDGATFRSAMYPLLNSYVRLLNKRANFDYIDHQNSHQPTLLSANPPKTSIDDQTESQTFGDPSLAGSTDEDLRRRSVSRAEANFVRQRAMQIQNEIGGTAVATMGNGGAFSAGPVTMKVVDREMNIYYLGEHLNVLPQRQISPVTDPLVLERSYNMEVCQAMGIPMSFMEGRTASGSSSASSSSSSGGVGGGKSGRSDQAHDNELLSHTLKDNREALQKFYQFIYENLFFEHDTYLIAKLMYDLETRQRYSRSIKKLTRGRWQMVEKHTGKKSGAAIAKKKREEEESEEEGEDEDSGGEANGADEKLAKPVYARRQQRIEEQKRYLIPDRRELELLTRMRNQRIEVCFPEDPLPQTVDPEQLAMAVAQGVVSPMEALNMGRDYLRKSHITNPKHELVRQQAMLMRLQLQQKMLEFQTMEEGVAQQGVQTQQVKVATKGEQQRQKLEAKAATEEGAAAATGGGGGGASAKKKRKTAK